MVSDSLTCLRVAASAKAGLRSSGACPPHIAYYGRRDATRLRAVTPSARFLKPCAADRRACPGSRHQRCGRASAPKKHSLSVWPPAGSGSMSAGAVA